MMLLGLVLQFFSQIERGYHYDVSVHAWDMSHSNTFETDLSGASDTRLVPSERSD